MQLNAIEADIAKSKGHVKYYRDKKGEMLKKISAMEKDLKALSEDAEVCGRFSFVGTLELRKFSCNHAIKKLLFLLTIMQYYL